MSSSYYAASGFDPAFIMAQIVALQALLYLDLGLWMMVLNALAGSHISTIGMCHFFSHRSIQLSFTGGWITMVAFFFNSLAGGFFLSIVVERAKKCLDFTFTAHFIHLCACSMYEGWPHSWEWWAIIVMRATVMALFGEFLCMRREMQEIPLMGARQKGSF